MDVTHTDIAQNPFYASVGVPEFWRFNGQVWRIYWLDAGVYQEVERSPTFSMVPKERLSAFLAEAKEDEVKAIKGLRAWWAEHDKLGE